MKERVKRIAPGVLLVNESEFVRYLQASEESLKELYMVRHGNAPKTDELIRFKHELEGA